MNSSNADSCIGFAMTVVATAAITTVVGAHLHEQSVLGLHRQNQDLAGAVQMQQGKIATLEEEVQSRDLLIQGMLMNK